jgi:UDP-3-O-[3-hydroxymyristoyl] glucosamine N-acyltransferase
VIESGVKIGARCVIHAGAFIGRNSVLGDDCEIRPNTVIHDGCVVGSRVIIHACAVIGGDGFGYYFTGERHERFPHVGGVILEDDVEIGACTCVDRAKFGNTVVGRGTKIDNQVQVAHNCRLGRHNVLVGQCGLGGSVRTGDYCVLGGRAVSFDNLTIGHRVQLAANSVITKDLPDGLKAGGFPAQDLQTELRDKAAVRRLPDLRAKLKALIERVERLEASAQRGA